MIVLDCCAALAMSLNTERGESLRGLLLSGEEVIAPRLLHAELAHALVKYARTGIITKKDIAVKGAQTLQLVDRFIDDETLWVEATTESVRLGYSSYDLFYFILARRTGATLFTLDKALIELCDKEGVDCLHEVSLGA